MVDRMAGYHFEMSFGPMVQALSPLVIERARAAGIAVSPPGYELRPRASMIRIAGTYWAGLRTGEVHFQIVEHRSDLDGGVLQELCVTSREVLSPFGVQEEQKGWTSTRLSKAVGLWLRNGSLVFHAWQDDRCSMEQQVLVDFDVWQALDAMARFASGEPSFGSALPDPVRVGKAYPAPTWARDFATKVNAEGAKVNASFSCDRMLVAGAVTLMERSDGS